MDENACCPAACCNPLVAEEMSLADAEATATMVSELLRREQRGVWAYYSLDPQAMARLAAVAATKEEAR